MTPSIDYDSPAALKRYLDQRGFGMQKKFGQNFLINRSARERLAEALGSSAGDAVWEVGPGLGSMTAELLDRDLAVTAFEIDRGFAAALGEVFAEKPNFRLVLGDALKTWPAERKERGEPRFFFGNLPYNIAATLLASYVEADLLFERSVVTVQKEVALRMVAAPGDKDYSSFTVLLASAYESKLLMTLKPGSFWPAPRVDSASVVLQRRPLDAPGARSARFRPLVRALFSSRRKTVRNNLESYLTSFPAAFPPGRFAADALAACGLDPSLRAERLEPAQFAALAAALDAAIGDAAKAASPKRGGSRSRP